MLDVDINFTKYHYYWVRIYKDESGVHWWQVEEHHHNDEKIDNQVEAADKANTFCTIPFTKSHNKTLDLCSKSKKRLEDMSTGVAIAAHFDQIFSKYKSVGDFE